MLAVCLRWGRRGGDSEARRQGKMPSKEGKEEDGEEATQPPQCPSANWCARVPIIRSACARASGGRPGQAAAQIVACPHELARAHAYELAHARAEVGDDNNDT